MNIEHLGIDEKLLTQHLLRILNHIVYTMAPDIVCFHRGMNVGHFIRYNVSQPSHEEYQMLDVFKGIAILQYLNK